MHQEINKDTRLCMSLAGQPGNFGTRFHNYLYRLLGLNYIYKAFTTNDIQAAIGGVRALGIRGCAVSEPFKESCIPFVDELELSATAVDSVNTLVNDNGLLRAYNTDYMAIARLIVEHQINKDTSFILQGSGSMAKAVAAALCDAGVGEGLIIARNETAGKALAQRYGYRWDSDIKDHQAKLIINVTPIGMQGSAEAERLAFPQAIIQQADIVFDVVAQPPATPLIRQAESANKKIITGVDVRVLQAVEQFVLYTGVRPNDKQTAEAAGYARQE